VLGPMSARGQGQPFKPSIIKRERRPSDGGARPAAREGPDSKPPAHSRARGNRAAAAGKLVDGETWEFTEDAAPAVSLSYRNRHCVRARCALLSARQCPQNVWQKMTHWRPCAAGAGRDRRPLRGRRAGW